MENTRKVKPWDEMSEKEKKAARKSWKRDLPEKFDVFCVGNLQTPTISGYHVPGNLYVSGNLMSGDVDVDESCFIDGNVDAFDFRVKGDCYIGGQIDSFGINVGDDFVISNRVQFWNEKVVVGGNIICDSNIRCGVLLSGGSIIVNGDLSTIGIRSCGDLEIHGNLSCGSINIEGSFILDGIFKAYAQASCYSIGVPFLYESR